MSAGDQGRGAVRSRRWFQELHWQILVAMAAAIVLGGVLRAVGLEQLGWLNASIEVIGDLFMRALKMIIVPLVLASVVVGISGIDIRSLGRLGGKTLGYYVMTTSFAVVLGLVVVNLVRPGVGVGLEREAAPTVAPSSLTDVVLDIIPENPFAAFAATFDLLSVIFFAILLGIAIAVAGRSDGPLGRFFDDLNAVMLTITDWVMALAPIGIFALLLEVVLSLGIDVVVDLSRYMITVAGALLLHGLVTLPLLLIVLARISPRDAFRSMAPALLTAFSTASSSATLPVTIDSVEKRAGVSEKVGGFVLPLGATVNMDGTALYEAVAAMFIAQAYGIELGLGGQVVVFLTATLAAIGAAGVPSAGLVTMVIVLESVGLPLEGIGLLVAVDRVLDMTRTAVNVWGDAAGAMIIAASEDELDRAVLARTNE